MSDLSNTQFFQVEPRPQISAGDILEIVFKALKEKGYNPVNQIVGYIIIKKKQKTLRSETLFVLRLKQWRR